MKMKRICYLFYIIFFTTGFTHATGINKDRWVEIDLFWFEKDQMQKSSDIFWKTMYPLFEDVSGEKGIIINVGWLMDYILEWNGELNSRIPLPQNMTIENQFNDGGFLVGSTDQRKDQWKDRFNKAHTEQVMNYEAWTYKDLKNFVTVFKRSAAKHGIKDIRVGTFILGCSYIYKGNTSTFFQKHPFEQYPDRAQIFNPTHILTDDNTKYGAYPDGIKAGLPITKFFGDQWGDLSRKVGLDAIVLRDNILGFGAYSRVGPFGRRASNDPVKVKEWSDATANLVRYTKQANPKALVIGYSNAATAVGDWRVNCFDLEAIAKQGYLDAYIDQTWAGAWNEVAQRPKEFWNNPSTGWTHQLAYMLMHAAILANTPTKHYFLTETFDAWESWDIIGTARERLRWGIWAYSHAGVKTPKGIKFPSGSYISWANQTKRLLTDNDVEFLRTETNNALRDLENIKEINGPTLVYSRSAMEWQNTNKPDEFMKEWIDESAGSLMKWNIPILTSTRIEYLDKVESDLFIVQTPIHLKEQELQNVHNLIVSGKPVLIIGSPVNGIDQSILQRTGFSGTSKSNNDVEFRGTLHDVTNEFTEGCHNSFLTYQYYSHNKLDEEMRGKVMYSVSESPVLIRKDNIIIWDAPDMLRNLPDAIRLYSKSTDEVLGSPVPYVVLARMLTRELAKKGYFHSIFEEINNPVWCGSWYTKDGKLKVLTGEMEEGLDHSDKGYSSFRMKFPSAFSGRCFVHEAWDGRNRFITSGNSMKYTLRKGESKLFEVYPVNQKE